MNIPTSTGPISIVFDIETIPQPESKLLQSMPPFDASEVKVGNLKDPALIQAKQYAAQEKHKADYLAKAALSPVTGEVAAIGMAFIPQDLTTPHDQQGHITILQVRGDLIGSKDSPTTEADLISGFWEAWRQLFNRERSTWIGHNILDFDLPYLVNRSRILGIPVPFGVLETYRNKVYFSSRFVDTRTHWLLGRKATDTPSSLDLISKAFGLEGKNGDGANFGKLVQENYDEAIAYLANDIVLTKTVALRMGLIS